MIYQIFVGRWENASLLSHSGQVFDQLLDYDWAHLISQGFNQVYLLGIFDNRGPIIVDSEEELDLSTQSHRLPSPFALRDHRAINPQLGNLDSFRTLVRKIQQSGLKVLVDFVPNHRATNHVWTQTSPDYFYQNHGEFVAEFSGDVYKLNYSNSRLFKQMITTLKQIQSWGVDGVRCDMAHLVPTVFWKQATAEIKKDSPDFLFYGEVYPESVFDTHLYTDFFEASFDGLYHGLLFNCLGKVINQEIPLDYLIDHLSYIQQQPWSSKMINYVANHDDVIDKLADFRESLTGLIMLLKGTALVFNGSLLDLNHRIAHHYYQELEESQNELIHTSNLKSLITLIQETNCDTLKFYKNNDLLVVQSTQDIPLMFYFNFTRDSKKIHIQSKNKGLLHSLKNNMELMSGHLEIFPVEN